jgi:hypothetical protein
MSKQKKYKDWYIDINQFKPMLNGSQIIIRDIEADDNAESENLMIIGLNEVNKDIKGGLSMKDAELICLAPKMKFAIDSILECINNTKIITLEDIKNILTKSIS